MPKPVNEKPSSNEDEFFARRDAELIKELREKADAERTAAERKSHQMKCPKCGAALEEREHHGVKIDVCPDCHGMWLDQGEIDILSKVTAQNPGSRMVQDLIQFFNRPTRK
jgi:uncharacterized protein